MTFIIFHHFTELFEDYTDIRIVYTLQGYRYVRILGYLYLRIGKHGGYYAK